MNHYKTFNTIQDYIFWQYSNIASAHTALKANREKYQTIDYMVRSRLFKGLTTGTMSVSSLYDDEKYKLNNILCCYCSCSGNLTLDHLIPRYSGGKDTGDNLVYACKNCNSSKNKKDLLVWSLEKDTFPPILVLRRYLKLSLKYFETENILLEPYKNLQDNCSLFRLDLLPYSYPQPKLLKL